LLIPGTRLSNLRSRNRPCSCGEMGMQTWPERAESALKAL